MKPGRRKYVIAAALSLLPLVGLGLGWGFYLGYHDNDWLSPASIGFVVATLLYSNVPAVICLIARSIDTIATKEIVLLDNGKSKTTGYDGVHFVCKMKYRKYQDGKNMLSPNKRTWFVFPDPEALKDYPLDQLIEITPESKEKKQ